MNRIDATFERLRAQKKRALMPYLTAGFPDVDTSVSLVVEAYRRGAAVIEIGVPYSDSLADGPVIQSSFLDALSAGFRVEQVFDIASRAREACPAALVLMVSYSVVYRYGPAAFVDAARGGGVDGLIVPDLPLEEAGALRGKAESHGLHLVGLVAPTTDAERRRRIVASSGGFVYSIARAGTTGERSDVGSAVEANVRALRDLTDLPVCVGFGITTPAHAAEVCRYADGAIVGSALIRRIAGLVGTGAGPDRIVAAAGEFCGELAAACVVPGEAG